MLKRTTLYSMPKYQIPKIFIKKNNFYGRFVKTLIVGAFIKFLN